MKSADYVMALILVALTKRWTNTASFIGIVLEETEKYSNVKIQKVTLEAHQGD